VGVLLGAPSDDHDAVLRAELAGYGRTPAYRRSFAAQGYSDEAAAIARAWDARDTRAAADAVSDAMLDDLFIRGDATTCRAAVADYGRAGVTTLVLIPIALDRDPADRQAARAHTLRALGPLAA
jgi:hypothetical protein